MDGSLTLWLTLTLTAVGLEVLTKTFTLLALAIGFATAALFTWMGFGVTVELLGALVAGGGCLLWLRRSSAGQALQEAEESRYSILSDDGDEVHISEWGADDQVEVVFRGRTWQAKLAQGFAPYGGLYKVREVREGALILEPDAPYRLKSDQAAR